MTEALNNCRTVGDLLLLLMSQRLGLTDKATEAESKDMTAVEDEICSALRYYGPALYRGELWWALLPARTGRVNHLPFGGAAESLPWPPTLASYAGASDLERTCGAARDPHWPAVEREHLKQHPACEVCGALAGCVGHHVAPFHLDRSLELDPGNLWTLCPGHHLLFGHFMSWRSFNPLVREDSKLWWAKIHGRP